jgi:ribosomal protein S18 acetylase RimI-like enzyme
MGATLPDLVIRRAVAADAGTIHAGLMMIAEHLDETHYITSTPDDILRHGFGEPPAFQALIAEHGAAFAGMSLWFASFSTWRGRPGAYIQDFVVDKAFRGKGVGEALMQATARAVRAEGGSYLRLAVDAENATAQKFYNRAGLEWWPHERVFVAYDEAFERIAGFGEQEQQPR